MQLSCELLMTQVVNIVCSYVLPYHPFQPYKSRHPWQPQKSRRPPILTPKQPKVAIFDKTDFWDLKYPPEVQVKHKTCSTICRTPVPAILNNKNSTRSAGGAKNSQNWPIFVPSKIPNFGCFWPLLPTRSIFFGSKWLEKVSPI